MAKENTVISVPRVIRAEAWEAYRRKLEQADGAMKQGPESVDIGTFKITPQEGSCRNVKVQDIVTKQVLEVERADVKDLIDGLKKAYGM